MNMWLTYQANMGTLLSKKEVLEYLLDGTMKSGLDDLFDEDKDLEKVLNNRVSSPGMLVPVLWKSYQVRASYWARLETLLSSWFTKKSDLIMKLILFPNF